MNKIKKYLFIFMLVLIGAFMDGESFIIRAEEEEEQQPVEVENLDANDQYIIIQGSETEKYNNVLYTTIRRITLKNIISQEDLDDYDSRVKVCEFIPEGNMENAVDQEYCIGYPVADEEYVFQLYGFQDGKKTITLYFYNKGNYDVESQIARTIVKEIVLDTTGPVIDITGGEYVYIPSGGKYVEEGATCVDDSGVVLGECVVTVEEANIDMNESGYQYVRYTATDFLGNEVSVVKKVLVEIKEDNSDQVIYWIGLGVGVAIIAAFLLLHAWKNKEKQKNQSVL